MLSSDKSLAVRCHHITKRYRNGTVGVSDVTFELPHGRVTGLLGPNGAGKSTMVNILTTAIRPTDGHFQIEGLEGAKERDKIRRIVGIVTQDFAVDWALTVQEHLMLFAMMNQKYQRVAREEVGMWLDTFDLTDKANTKILQLSGGQGRRVQLIRCLMANLPVVFVDEPTLGLDPKGVEVVLRSLRQMAVGGACVVMASNAMDQVESGCDDVVFMQRGRLLDHGSVQYFLDRYGGPELVTITIISERRPEWASDLAGIPDIEGTAPQQWQLSFSVPRASEAIPLLINQASDARLKLSSVTTKPKTLKSIYMGMSPRGREAI